MKRVIAFVFCACLLAGVANAAGAASKYTVGNVVQVKATDSVNVQYKGATIVIPQGNTIVVGRDKNDSVVIQGENIKGVKYGNSTISSKGHSVFLVDSQTGDIKVMEGKVALTDASGKTTTYSKNQVIKKAATTGQAAASSTEAKAETTTSDDETDPVVLDLALLSTTENSAARQQVAEDAVLSPSAPR
ncbi:MAG: hypothetical protein LBM71_01805 [Elusimicrobiota bacterium]|jgi:hypothetical protein|nr:hypothetical protein [Elusimicrobiota bacterium]